MKAYYINLCFAFMAFIFALIFILIFYCKWKKVKARSESIQRRFLKQPFKKLNFWNFINNKKNSTSVSIVLGLLIFALIETINWNEVFLFLDNLNWKTVAENSFSGLFVGVFVGGMGYLIWKKQHFYQKRKEVYAELIPYIIKLKIYLKREIDNTENNKHLEQKMTEEIMYKTLPLAHQFAVYYDYSYLNNVNDLVLLLNKLRKEEETGMNDRELEEYVNLTANRIISANHN